MQKKQIVSEDIKSILESNLPMERLYGKTVLISGANGYVPAYFVHTFMRLNSEKNAGIKVLALCRNKERAENRFFEYLDRDDFQIIIQDVCDEIIVEEEVHIFIHAASPAGIQARHNAPANTFLANVKGCENMLNLAVKNPCEFFLFISSVDIYGKMQGTQRLREDDSGYLDTMNVRNAYSCSKRAAENLCMTYFQQYGIPIYVVRPFQIIGPGPELNDGRLHIDFISQMLKGNKIVLKSDGTARRTFLYITDAIVGMLAVLLKGKAGEAYNVVDEKGEASVKELAAIMAANVSERKIEVVYDYEKRTSIEVTSALSVVVGDSEKIAALGWVPKVSLVEGSARMMKYYGLY